MIITRTPLRISLFGGGSDFKDYYKHKNGEVVSFAIDKYVYVQVNKKFDGRLHLRYSKTELVDTVDELKHDIVRECLKYFGISKGIEVVISSDVPSVGTGLGSSSALTVGLVKALFEYRGLYPFSLEFLANVACDIEINRVGSPIGKQDQYACAVGGLNWITFEKTERVFVRPLYDLYRERIDEVLSSLVLFYIPDGRNSLEIHKEHQINLKNNFRIMDTNVKLVSKFLNMLDGPDYNARQLGKMLSKGWEVKKKNSLVSNEVVEKVFVVAKEGGALGGKICGAGSGGFMLLVKENDVLEEVMEKAGYRKVNFKISKEGSQIIFRG